MIGLASLGIKVDFLKVITTLFALICSMLIWFLLGFYNDFKNLEKNYNQHAIWASGRSQSVDDLSRKIDNLSGKIDDLIVVVYSNFGEKKKRN